MESEETKLWTVGLFEHPLDGSHCSFCFSISLRAWGTEHNMLKPYVLAKWEKSVELYWGPFLETITSGIL